jgi:hypothetical protein
MKGHGRFKCPNLLAYGHPLPDKNWDVRSQLAQQLSSAGSILSRSRTDCDKRIIYKSTPRSGIEALILHQCFLKSNLISGTVGADGFCIEATLLHDSGREHDTYKKALFEADCLARFVLKAGSNLVVSQLKVSSGAQSSFLAHLGLYGLSQEAASLSQEDGSKTGSK